MTEIFNSNPFYSTGCLAFLCHNDILHPVLSCLASNSLIIVEKLKICYKMSLWCKHTELMQILGRFFDVPQPNNTVLHYLSECMDT